VHVFKHDTDLGQDDLDAISEAFRRAGSLLLAAGRACPPDRVRCEVERLIAGDRTGYRAWLMEEELGGSAP
jgi:hypothetical protein